MKIILAILGSILAMPIVIVAATLLLGVGAGFMIRLFSIEVLLIAGVILLFMLIKRIFR